jgi:hypothetical protein
MRVVIPISTTANLLMALYTVRSERLLRPSTNRALTLLPDFPHLTVK